MVEIVQGYNLNPYIRFDDSGLPFADDFDDGIYQDKWRVSSINGGTLTEEVGALHFDTGYTEPGEASYIRLPAYFLFDTTH